MISKEDAIKFISEIIDALTWKRVWLLCLLTSTCIVMYVLFENRTTIFNKMFDNQPIETLEVPWKISDTSRSELQAVVNQQLIGGTIITDVNLKKNRKILKYWFFENDGINQEIARVTSEILPQPFFDNSKRNNDQMLDVLGNKFVCVPTTDIAFSKFVTILASEYPYVCQLAVPPYVGEFAGYISVYLVRQPTVLEQETIKIEVNRISIELYLRDIQNHTKNQR